MRDYGVKDGSSVTIELGAVAATPDACLLRCIPVFGNDTAEKFNPKLAGTRLSSLCTEIAFKKTDNDSIEQVRLQFMHQINKTIRDIFSKSSSSKEGSQLAESSSAHLGNIAEFSSENCRLRVTNWAEEAIELPLSELNSEKQPVSLHQVVGTGLIKNRTTLLLELGKPSVPGFCELELYYMPAASASRSDYNEAELSAEKFENDLMAHEVVRKRLIRIATMQLNLDTSLIDLQSQALSALIENISKLLESNTGPDESATVIPEIIEDFVLREVREDMDGVPGRCLWIRGGPLAALADPAAAAVAAIVEPPPQTVPLSSAAGGKKGKGKSSRNQAVSTPVASHPAPAAVDKNTIRRLKLHSGSRKLVISSFSNNQKHSSSIPSAGAFYLWLFTGRPVANSGDTTVNYTHSPSGPAINILLSGGAAPSLPQLKRAIESERGIPFSQQRIFKFFASEHLWKDLNMLSEKKRSASGIDNLLAVPFSLKEGDMLCVVDSLASDKTAVVDTTADIRYRAQIAIHGERKGGAGGKKKRPQEVMLRLTADDFSSDDEVGSDDPIK